MVSVAAFVKVQSLIENTVVVPSGISTQVASAAENAQPLAEKMAQRDLMAWPPIGLMDCVFVKANEPLPDIDVVAVSRVRRSGGPAVIFDQAVLYCHNALKSALTETALIAVQIHVQQRQVAAADDQDESPRSDRRWHFAGLPR